MLVISSFLSASGLTSRLYLRKYFYDRYCGNISSDLIELAPSFVSRSAVLVKTSSLLCLVTSVTFLELQHSQILNVSRHFLCSTFAQIAHENGLGTFSQIKTKQGTTLLQSFLSVSQHSENELVVPHMYSLLIACFSSLVLIKASNYIYF